LHCTFHTIGILGQKNVIEKIIYAHGEDAVLVDTHRHVDCDLTPNHTQAHTHTHVRARTHTHHMHTAHKTMSEQNTLNTHTHTHTHTQACLHVRMYIRMYVYTYACVYVRTYVQIYIFRPNFQSVCKYVCSVSVCEEAGRE
jgi:hypothetical protein